MRRSLLIHTTDPEFYLILRYILEEAGHRVDLVSNLEKELQGSPSPPRENRIVLICLAQEDLARSAALIRKRHPKITIIGLPLGDWQIDGPCGASFDYFVKRPFDPGALLAFLRLGSGSSHAANKLIRLGDVEMNIATVRVRRGNAEINLSPLHFRILLHIAKNPDSVVSREEIIRTCWPEGANVEPRTVDIHVGRIRQSLNKHGGDLIRTVRSVGYTAAGLD